MTLLLGLAGCAAAPGPSGGVPAPSEAAPAFPGGGVVAEGAGPAPERAPAASQVAASVAPAPASSGPSPTFRADARTLSEAERASMIGVSWREGCPVPLDTLRRLELSVHRPDGTPTTGALVVHAEAVEPISAAFRALWDAGYPIERMEPVEAFSGDDRASMVANNTSAFNCRTIAGSQTVSQHAWGLAVDVNPRQNPFVHVRADGTVRVDPPEAAEWADRSRAEPGVIHPGDPTVRAFAAVGWAWGGAWTKSKDYQHFSRSGG